MIQVVSWNRQAGRRYPQFVRSAAIASALLVATSVGAPVGGASPGTGVEHRRYPQALYSRGATTGAHTIGFKRWTSVGSPAGGSGGGPGTGVEHRRYSQHTYRRGRVSSAHALGEALATSVGSPIGGGSSTGGISKSRVVMNAMEPLKLATARNIMIWMADSADGKTGKTGLTPSMVVTISKDGAAFTTISPSVVERGSGWYNVPLSPTNTDTLGDLAFHITATGADPCDFKLPVEVDRTGLIATHTAGALAEIRNQILLGIQSDVLPDSIPPAGQRGSLGQYMYQSGQYLVNRYALGLTHVIRKPNGTVLLVLTIDDATNPTDVHP